MDLDHTIPFVPPDEGGPPGENRGSDALARSRDTEHRIKTHDRWQFRQPSPGVFLCRSRFGALYLITSASSQSLGDGE